MSEVGGTDSHQWMEAQKPQAGHPDPRQTAEDRVMQQMQLTREELRILKECNQESFWYRCVPLAIVGVTATQMAVNRGMLAPHPKYGALFKNMAAGLAGYVVGKLSYTRVCKEKMMKLDNSQLAEALRRQKYGRPFPGRAEQSEFIPEDGQSAFPGAERKSNSDDYSNLDISSDSNRQYKGLDDSFRPTLDSVPPSNRDYSSQHQTQQETILAKPQISYDELRRRNREDYQKRTQQQPPQSGQVGPRSGYPPRSQPQGQENSPGYIASPPGSYQPSPTREPPSRQYGDPDQPRLGSASRSGGVKNKYGDTWN